jgi:hypothetical protein
LSFAVSKRHPVDLVRGPLFRPVLFRFGPEEHDLLVSVHHIVVDGWSFGILAGELDALYSAYMEGRSSPLAELPLQSADFALWQRQWLTGDVLETQRRYWLEQLADLPEPVRLRSDYARAQPTTAGASHDLEIPGALGDALRRLSRSESVTMFMTLLAGFKALLARYADQEEIVVGTPVANRRHVDLEPIVGLFANTLVLRTRLDGDPTFRQLLRRVCEVSLGAFAHQEMPFEQLVEELQPAREMGQNPLFQIAFVFQGASTGPGFGFVTVASPFDLTMFLREQLDGTLRVTLEYKRDLFPPETIGRLGSHYRSLLEAMAADPDAPLSTAGLVTDRGGVDADAHWTDERDEPPRIGRHGAGDGLDAQGRELLGDLARAVDRIGDRRGDTLHDRRHLGLVASLAQDVDGDLDAGLRALGAVLAALVRVGVARNERPASRLARHQRPR